MKGGNVVRAEAQGAVEFERRLRFHVQFNVDDANMVMEFRRLPGPCPPPPARRDAPREVVFFVQGPSVGIQIVAAVRGQFRRPFGQGDRFIILCGRGAFIARL